MIRFLLLLFMSSIFCENKAIGNLEQQGFVNYYEDTESIYFDQRNLHNIRWYISHSGLKVFRLRLRNPRPLDKLNVIFEAFIEYGNNQGFDTQTKLGKINIASFAPDLSQQKPDLNGQEYETFKVTSFVLDPQMFGLSKDVTLSVILDEKTQTIYKSSAMDQLIKQIVGAKIARDKEKQNKYLRFFDDNIAEPVNNLINSFTKKINTFNKKHPYLMTAIVAVEIGFLYHFLHD